MNKFACLALVTLLAAPFAEAQKKKIKTKTEVVIPAATPAPEVAPPKPTAETFAQTITATDLSEYLHVLASDEFEGRETGLKGQKLAAEYISAFFRKNGIPSPEKLPTPYYQKFELEQSSWKDATLKAGKKTFSLKNDFYLMGDVTQETQKLDLVFAGYGIEDKGYSDYKNLNVKGKTVVVLAGEPKDDKGNYLLSKSQEPGSWTRNIRQKYRLALNKGAKGIIYLFTDEDGNFKTRMEPYRHMLESPGLTFAGSSKRAVSMFVSPEVGATLLNTKPKKIADYQKAVAKAGKPIPSPFKLNTDISLKAAKNRKSIPTENVLGYIEGSDKKEELLVITAHYDHVGKDSTLAGDQIFNGADDDGSGTSAVMEMAQAFKLAKDAGMGPRRSILFMLVTAEEKGLLGSEYYTEHPVFPLKQTVANLNIDMIGRLDKAHENDKNYVYVIGSDKLSSELHKINETANQRYTSLKLDYTFNDENDPNQFYYRSDHYNFAKNGIPVAFYFNGVHDDYHQPGDEVDKILFDKMEKISRLVFHTAWELANREERIKVDSNKK